MIRCVTLYRFPHVVVVSGGVGKGGVGIKLFFLSFFIGVGVRGREKVKRDERKFDT